MMTVNGDERLRAQLVTASPRHRVTHCQPLPLVVQYPVTAVLAVREFVEMNCIALHYIALARLLASDELYACLCCRRRVVFVRPSLPRT